MLSLLVILSALSIAAQSNKECAGVEIVRRKEWFSRVAYRSANVKLPLNHVVIQHTVTPFCKNKPQCGRNVRFIQDMHLDERGWWDIAYNFLVGGDGRIYEGRGWDKSGAHSVNFNSKSLGIAFIGNYQKYAPVEAQINATLNLIACGVEKGYLTPIREIHGHRDVSCTISPGDYVYAVIRLWDGYKGGKLRDYNCEPLQPPLIDNDELDY